MQKAIFGFLVGMVMAVAMMGCDRASLAEQPAAAEPGVADQVQAGARRFRCGDVLVMFTPLADETADMRIGQSSYAMQRVVSASGAKYENPGNPDTSFWDKGSQALVTIAGERLEECTLLTDETITDSAQGSAPLQDISWRLEDLDRTGIIDNSHLTLMLSADGGLNGSGGCNKYNGSYELAGDTITINPNMAVTSMACADALMFQEQRYLSLLTTMSTTTIDESNALILTNPDGQTLTFRN